VFKAMENDQLVDFYNKLKSNLDSDGPINSPHKMPVGNVAMGLNHPDAIAFKRKAYNACNELKDKCYKHILLDIYMNILPLDSDYVDGHRGKFSDHIDCALANKGMTPTEYFKSAAEKTNAPLVEFVIHSVDNIGRAYMEAEDEKLKDAQENNIQADAPEAPDPEDDPDIENQLVDVEKDDEYESFVDKLKKKTINKIVADISKIIADKKEESDMTFDTQPVDSQAAMGESVVTVSVDYAEKKLMQEGVEITSEMQDNIIADAICEATLNEIDRVFYQPNSDMVSVMRSIRMGKGSIMNESAIDRFMEGTDLFLESKSRKRGRLKIYDKAAWHIDGGEDEKEVVAKFKAIIEFLDSKGMLSKAGKEIIKSGIDESISIHENMLTNEGNNFMDTCYNNIINKSSKSIKSALEREYDVYKSNNRCELKVLHSVGPIKFGMSREKVRKLFDNKYKEFKKTKNSKNMTDDFGGKFHVYYSENDKVEAVEIFENVQVILDDKVIFPISISKIKESIPGIEKTDNSSYTNKEKSIGLAIDGNKVVSILLGNKNYFNNK
jgi:hypothetical protein